MDIFDTADLTPDTVLSADMTSNIYNGLDSCVTFEVYNVLAEELLSRPDHVKQTYRAVFDKLPALMHMSILGLDISPIEHHKQVNILRARYIKLLKNFNSLCMGILGELINHKSPAQTNHLFYTRLKLPPVTKRSSSTGKYNPTTDRPALEKLRGHFYARPFISHILALRDVGRFLSWAEGCIGTNGKLNYSFNPVGTVTGRLSSKDNVFREGGNAQNVDRRARKMIVPPPGRTFVNVDIEQGDSRNLGAIMYNLFYDELGPEEAGRYLDACESSDLHTYVASLVWTDLAWTENLKANRAIADEIFYRELTHRDMCKKVGHGTNYYGQPDAIAKQTNVPAKLISNFQDNYFSAFPTIPLYHASVRETLRTEGVLITPFGRERRFYGDTTSDEVFREALAFSPQSMTGEQIDRGYVAVWKNHRDIWPHGQFHDACLFSVPTPILNKCTQTILHEMEVALPLRGGRLFTAGLEAKVGWNWGDFDAETNPLGLAKYRGEETRTPPPRAFKD